MDANDLLAGPGNWSREFSGCNSDHQFQSPINIVPEQAHFDDTREKITFTMTHSEKKCNSVLFNDAKTGFTHAYLSVKLDYA